MLMCTAEFQVSFSLMYHAIKFILISAVYLYFQIFVVISFLFVFAL